MTQIQLKGRKTLVSYFKGNRKRRFSYFGILNETERKLNLKKLMGFDNKDLYSKTLYMQHGEDNFRNDEATITKLFFLKNI